MQAFFALYSFNENEKIKLFNAHLGGEVRKFLQNEDMEKLDSVEKLQELFRCTFSEKYDWQNVLMNIQQKPDEKVRPFSVRLRVAARKCGFQGSTLDNMCVNYLKRSCAPHLRTLLGNCLPGTPYDVIVEHAIQHERTKELDQAEKKTTKRKSEDLDVTETNEKNLEKKIKQDYTNTIKQLKDQEKKFDFVKLNERAKAFIKNRRQNTSTTAFNPGSPTHSGF